MNEFSSGFGLVLSLNTNVLQFLVVAVIHLFELFGVSFLPVLVCLACRLILISFFI